ncbi:MAG: hypothetical protein HY608_10765 [Planctomycetes bacterium]|nr:hypothetical protein [Planctomycetota bacterium]
MSGRQGCRGSTLLVAVVAMIGLSAACLAYYGLTNVHASENANRESLARAMTIAEAGANASVRAIANGETGNLGVTEFDDGQYEVAVTDNGDNTYTLRATGTYASASRTIEVDVATPSLSAIVRGAITARASIDTLGSLIVDGRDYNAAGVLVDAGTYGISTPGDFDQGGSSKIGGQGAAPARPALPNSYEEFADPPYPSTPEEVFGLAEGDLDSIKTDVPPTFPLDNEIYYYTGDLIDATIEGSGILIVHNDTGTALLKNLQGGLFTGIIIADDIQHIHNDILGAIMHLSDTSSGNCIGNGSGRVRYSSEVIAALAGTGVQGLFPVRNCWRNVTFDAGGE